MNENEKAIAATMALKLNSENYCVKDNEIIFTAQKYVDSGISVIPLQADTTPAIADWKVYQNRLMEYEEIQTLFSMPEVSGIGIVYGKISGNLECIEIALPNDTSGTLYSNFEYQLTKYHPEIVNQILIARTINNGYHLMYRCDLIGGNTKLASRMSTDDELKENPNEMVKTLIETRGNGDYMTTYLWPEYQIIQGDITSIPYIDIETRESLLTIAGSFNKASSHTNMNHSFDISSLDPSNPINDYNQKGDVLALLESKGWRQNGNNGQSIFLAHPGKSKGNSAIYQFEFRLFYVFTTSTEFETGKAYNPSRVYAQLNCDGDMNAASEKLLAEGYGSRFNHWDNKSADSTKGPYTDGKYSTNATENFHRYLRIGCDYYKIVYMQDRYVKSKKILKPWKKSEILQDLKIKDLSPIPKYDGFIMVPDNISYQSVINGTFYNLYSPFPHKPHEGNVEASLCMVKHIFGDQYALGLEYMQCLYQFPKQALPILVLVSKKRQTGKTTFLNWLNAIFGDNMVIVQNNDILSDFNAVYSLKNVIAVDETLIEKSSVTERLKSIATAKKMIVNAKYVSQYSVDFYGKLILCSNKEIDLIKIDHEEVRFWIRKIEPPEVDDPDYETKLISEIPAFLYFLNQQQPLKIRSRMVFLPEEIATKELADIKYTSQSNLCKEIIEIFTHFFENDASHLDSVYAAPVDIKERFFESNKNVSSSQISAVLKQEMQLAPSQSSKRYIPFIADPTKTGRFYKFERSAFTDEPTKIFSPYDLSQHMPEV